MSVLLKLARIVQSAVEADSAAVQVNCIVDGIQREMDVDVCTLFLTNDGGDLAIVASHGLGGAAIGRATVPVGKGLVGEVAATRHPLNIVDPAAHPAFYYVQGSEEEKFRSFCAVPLVRCGDVLGVLAVQRFKPEKLSTDDEAFLVTIGAQLALVVANWEDWQLDGTTSPRGLPGVRGAPGIGIGQVVLCEDLDLFSVVDTHCADPDSEIARWHTLLDRVVSEVREEQSSLDRALSKEIASVFDAYLMLLADPTLSDGVVQGIKGGLELTSALRSTVQHYSDLFMAMEDPYLRARHEDIHHLGNRLYSTWRKSGEDRVETAPEGPVVLVGNQVSVSDIARIPRARLMGVVSFQGSSLSHTAILANALGVPAVMGTGEFKGIKDGDSILVDGNAARVFLHPDRVLSNEYKRLLDTEIKLAEQLTELREKPAITRDGVTIALLANSGLTADILPGLTNGAEGLGLYRTEIPFMISDAFPSEDEQYQLYREVMEAYREKPVYMRVLDIGADKPLPYFPIREENPALGWRGIRFCLDNTSLLVTQLRAMLRASIGTNNLQIILPMVSSITELSDFRTILDDATRQLKEEDLDVRRPPVGIMIEVPAAISQLQKWHTYIDFVSIGSNDLSQYITAVDRNNPRVASKYDHLHPAILAEISRVVESAGRLRLPVSVCGEMSSDPHAVVLLVGMGIRQLSMSAALLPKIKWIIRAMDAAAAHKLCCSTLEALDSDEIRNMTTEYLSSLGVPGIAA